MNRYLAKIDGDLAMVILGDHGGMQDQIREAIRQRWLCLQDEIGAEGRSRLLDRPIVKEIIEDVVYGDCRIAITQDHLQAISFPLRLAIDEIFRDRMREIETFIILTALDRMDEITMEEGEAIEDVQTV